MTKPANGSLTPTTIVDKNGKTTTVHRKALKVALASSIPAPVATKAKSPDELATLAMKHLSAIEGYPNRLPGNSHFNLAALAEESPEALEELVSHISRAGDTEVQCWSKTFQTSVPHSKHRLYKEGTDLVENYRREMVAMPLAVRLAVKSDVYSHTRLADSSIAKAYEYCDGNYGENLERLRAGIIVHTVKQLHNNYDSTTEHVEGNEGRDTEFIAEHIEDVESVLDAVANRCSTDPAVLQEMMNLHSSIADGVL